MSLGNEEAPLKEVEGVSRDIAKKFFTSDTPIGKGHSHGVITRYNSSISYEEDTLGVRMQDRTNVYSHGFITLLQYDDTYSYRAADLDNLRRTHIDMAAFASLLRTLTPELMKELLEELDNE